jgi:hypothetical protein
MRYLLVFLFIFCLLYCKNDKPKIESNSIEYNELSNNDTSSYKQGYFWVKNCINSDFKLLFDCNTENYELYQIALNNDLVKDCVFISLMFRNEQISEIYLTKLYLSPNKNLLKQKKFNKKIIFNAPDSSRLMYCYYNKPVKVTWKIDLLKLSTFFNEILWLKPLQINYKGHDTDTEIWYINGRKNGKEGYWSGFVTAKLDSIYYTNLQALLDICKVTDYKYTKKE